MFLDFINSYNDCLVKCQYDLRCLFKLSVNDLSQLGRYIISFNYTSNEINGKIIVKASSVT